jgi:serine/threonine protein kinase
MWQDLQPGDPELIGPYRLRGVLGVGGMGRVFLGVSPEGRQVAVKVIRTDLAADPEFRASFEREIAIARKVSGPFTAPVIDADLEGPEPWLATAYVAGPSLAAAVAEHGPMAPRLVLELASALAEGLSVIHAAGVAHRDLKPSNVLLAQDGPRLIDFGISRASGATAMAGSGPTMGSPGFMSPEQAEGWPAGPSSDIFSLGAVLTFAATGEGPFGTGSPAALIYRVIHRPADLGHVPQEVRGLVERCLIKDPALRPTARDVLAATGAPRPLTVRLPEPVTRPLVPPPPPPAAPEAVTEPMPIRVPLDQLLMAPDLPSSEAAADRESRRPPRSRSRPRRARPSRPLTTAAVIVVLLAAAVTADLTVDVAHPPSPAAQSERQVTHARPTVPPPSSPADSPAAVRRTASAAPRPATTAPPAATTAPPAGGSAPAAGTTPLSDDTPMADTAPSASTDPPVRSSTRPSAHPSATRRPSPSASASPTPSGTPTPSPTPTPASGGYGY